MTLHPTTAEVMRWLLDNKEVQFKPKRAHGIPMSWGGKPRWKDFAFAPGGVDINTYINDYRLKPEPEVAYDWSKRRGSDTTPVIQVVRREAQKTTLNADYLALLNFIIEDHDY